jgi:hypothetical protein
VDSFAYGVRGSGPLVDVYLGANWWDQPRCGLFLSVGYRYARVGEVKIGGSVAHNPDTSKFTLDYSGVLLRLGFKLPLTAPAGAPAATVGAGVKPWIGISGSWGAYAMGDVNRDIADRNRELAGTGPSLNRIHGGFGLGASAGLDFPARLSLGIGYDRLAAATEAGGGAGSLKIRHPANTFRALAEYRLPGRGNLEARLGVAGGTVMEAGSESVKFTGSGPLLEAYASSDWRATPHLALTASLGYRYAKVSEVKAGQEVMFKADGSRFTVDYSGVLLRLGLKAALAK